MPTTTSKPKTIKSEVAVPANGTEIDASDTRFGNDPAWIGEMLGKYLGGVSSVFIIEGNTHDYYQYLGEKLRGCLLGNLRDKVLSNGQPLFGIIVSFSRYARFTFLSEDMRDKFLEIANKSQTSVKLPAALTPDNLNTLAGQYGMSFVVAVLNSVLAYKGKDAVPMAVLFEYAETLVPATEQLGEGERLTYTALSDWSKDQLVGAPGNLGRQRHLVMLLSEETNSLYAPLRRTVREVVTIPMPDVDARQAFIEMLHGQSQYRKIKWDTDLTARLFANMTAGLTLRQIEDIFLLANNEGQPVTPALIRRRKDELIKNEYGDVLNISDPRLKLDGLGGLTTIKPYLLQKVVRPMLLGKARRVPNGVLFTGPAGTGKTMLAEALAGEIGCTFVKFNIAKIKDKFVGASERNMMRMLDMLSVITPVLIFIDEADQVIGQSREASGDSGVSSNLFGMLLGWAADTSRRGKVLLVGATNRPDLIDAALLREGRFDVKVPVLAPERDERSEILAVQLARYFGQEVAAGQVVLPTQAELAPITDGLQNYTGAILEAIVSQAYGEWDDAEGEMSVLEAVALIGQSLRPTTAEIESMSRLAIESCSDLRVLPPRYREELEQARTTQSGGIGVEEKGYTRAASRDF